MSEGRWTEDDFVQLARPKMMAAANPAALPHLLFEFLAEALPHYDDATVDGKTYIDKAVESVVAVFKVSRHEDFNTAATSKLESVRGPLETLILTWLDKREAFLRIQETKEFS
jgi:hypothetical protein